MIYRACIERTIAKSESSALKDIAPDLVSRSLLPEDFEIERTTNHADVLSAIEHNLASAFVDVDLESVRDTIHFIPAFRELARAFGLRGKLKRFRASFDYEKGQASVAFEHDGKYYQSSWRLDRPWINEELLKLMNSAFTGSTKKELILLNTQGVDSIYIAPRGSAKLIREVGECAIFETDPDVIKSGKLVASGLITLLGLIVTFAGTYFFLGLTQAAIVSVAIWAAFFATMFIAHAWRAKGDRELLEMEDEDSGQMMAA